LNEHIVPWCHLSPSLSPTQHINRLISICNQRLFLLSQLKRQGLPVEALDVIFKLSYSQRHCSGKRVQRLKKNVKSHVFWILKKKRKKRKKTVHIVSQAT